MHHLPREVGGVFSNGEWDPGLPEKSGKIFAKTLSRVMKKHTICRLVHYGNHYPLYQTIFDDIRFDSWFWASFQDLIDHDKRETTHQDQLLILHATGP